MQTLLVSSITPVVEARAYYRTNWGSGCLCMLCRSGVYA
jgi:hypothetical protein